MTLKEFESLRRDIQKEKLMVTSEIGPLRFATERAQFKAGQLRKLIEMGRSVKDSKTIKNKIVRWERELKRMEMVPQRIAQIRTLTPTR